MKRITLSILSLIVVTGLGCSRPEEPAAALDGATDEFVRDPAAVTNITWQWVSTITPVESMEVSEPERYTILLEPEGKLRARFDCNRGGGDYTISVGTLSLGPLISTRMACPEDSLDARFMRDLKRVTSFFVRHGDLYLEMPVDSGTLRFRAMTPPDKP